MQNPFQQTAGGNLNDPLAFVKKLWGDMQLPGMVTPTLSVDELDKQIKDLKTVESWLNVNMNMLKGTIQALEVQRATISALKTMGESFAQAGNAAPSASSAPGANSTNSTNSTNSNHTSWPMHGNSHNAAPNAVPEPSVEENEEDEMPEDEAEPDTDQKQEQAKPDNVKQQEQTQFHNPAAWWTVLQDQFKQALSHAMKDEETAVSVDQPKRTAKVAAGKSGSGSKPRATAAKTATAKAKASAATSAASKRKTVANKAAKMTSKNTAKSRAT